jgi:hypothetical protein
MPNESRLEAHSGFGDIRDDPRHVSDQNVGPTPPAVYELKLRERPFHGVQALRMILVEGNTLRRPGILAHGYMLGPEGDSNGCVSIKDYDQFLAAFRRGDITSLVVITPPSWHAALFCKVQPLQVMSVSLVQRAAGRCSGVPAQQILGSFCQNCLCRLNIFPAMPFWPYMPS